jgi:serine/threonine-protein kinase
VVNIPVGEAEQRLRDAGLDVQRGDSAYDNSGDVPRDNVLGLDPVFDDAGAPRAYRTGDVVTIHLSLGQDLVEVPNVVGLSWGNAKGILDEAGFLFDYNTAADELPSVEVESTDPEGGELALRGTVITVTF